ncbi:hypothetical protein [Flavobacterium ginsengiterrae]|uniref:Uncharacterized protein n=1 Tax=Flavobacterium ginsengiterrae TaxID=871695 RepID=A0ABP7GG23_9FLAO
MNKTLKTLALILFLMNSYSFFAQNNQKVDLQKTENQAKTTSVENHRKLDDKIAELQKQLNEIEKQKKEIETKKKNLVKTEKKLQSTKEKISRLEEENQKIENKIITASSDEEIQKKEDKNNAKRCQYPKIKIIINNAAKRA